MESFTRKEWRQHLQEHNFFIGDDKEKIALGRACTNALLRVFVDHFWSKPTEFYIIRANRAIPKLRDAYFADAVAKSTWIKPLLAQIKSASPELVPVLKERVVQNRDLTETVCKVMLETFTNEPQTISSVLGDLSSNEECLRKNLSLLQRLDPTKSQLFETVIASMQNEIGGLQKQRQVFLDALEESLSHGTSKTVLTNLASLKGLIEDEELRLRVLQNSNPTIQELVRILLVDKSKIDGSISTNDPATLVNKLTTSPMAFAAIILPMFEPLAEGASHIMKNSEIRKNVERLFSGNEQKFKDKLGYSLQVFQSLLEASVLRNPENSLGKNINETAKDALGQVRKVIEYLRTHASTMEESIQQDKKLEIHDVNPALCNYLQGILKLIYSYKMDKTKKVPATIEWACSFKTLLAPALKWKVTQWSAVHAAKHYIMKYLMPVFNNPPLSEQEQSSLGSLVESALTIAFESGIAQMVFDFLTVIVEYKTLPVDALIEKAMPQLEAFITFFETKVIDQWQLDSAVNEVMH